MFANNTAAQSMSWDSFACAVSGEKQPPWPLHTELYPTVTIFIHQIGGWLNHFQPGKDNVLVIWCLGSRTTQPLTCPTVSTAFHGKSSNKMLHPKKETNPRVCNSCYRYHVALELSVMFFEMSNNWPSHRCTVSTFTEVQIISQCCQVNPHDFESMHSSQATD